MEAAGGKGVGRRGRGRTGGVQGGGELGHLSARCVPGMTMEMAGTLLGAAAHGLIVSGAHGPHRCEDTEFPGPGAASPDAVSARCDRAPPTLSASAEEEAGPGRWGRRERARGWGPRGALGRALLGASHPTPTGVKREGTLPSHGMGGGGPCPLEPSSSAVVAIKQP